MKSLLRYRALWAGALMMALFLTMTACQGGGSTGSSGDDRDDIDEYALRAYIKNLRQYVPPEFGDPEPGMLFKVEVHWGSKPVIDIIIEGWWIRNSEEDHITIPGVVIDPPPEPG